MTRHYYKNTNFGENVDWAECCCETLCFATCFVLWLNLLRCVSHFLHQHKSVLSTLSALCDTRSAY